MSEQEAKDRIRIYTSLIEQNIKTLLELKEKIVCRQDKDGNWILTRQEEADKNGHHIVEVRTIQVEKKLAEEIFFQFLGQEMQNEAAYHLYEPEYKKRHPDFNYSTADQKEKDIFKRQTIEWFKRAFEQHKQEASKYVEDHYDELLKPVQERLLKEKIFEPVVVNYATLKTIQNVGKEPYQSATDIGHCAKSILTYMYQLQRQYGGYSFLPKNPNIAAQPETLFEYFEKNWKDKVEHTEDIARTFKDHQPSYEKGTLAFIDNGHGRHLMMYLGLNENGEPEFIGFNPSAERQVLIKQKKGEIIDIPNLIRDENSSNLALPQKEVEMTTLKTPQQGIVAIHMTISRSSDGIPIKGFQGTIEIPNPLYFQPERTSQDKIRELTDAQKKALQAREQKQIQ